MRYPIKQSNQMEFNLPSLLNYAKETGMSLDDTIAMFISELGIDLRMYGKPNFNISLGDFRLDEKSIYNLYRLTLPKHDIVVTLNYIFYIDKETRLIVAIGVGSAEGHCILDKFYFVVN